MSLTTASGGLAVPEDLETGLEDYDPSTDSVMPRLTIVGESAQFKDNLTGQTYDALNVILLGLVKGRVLWDNDVEDGEKPLCKSLDFQHGMPDQSGRFPLAESLFPEILPILPCSGCHLKEWGTAADGKKPWCSEQHTYPLLMEVADGQWAPAIFTTQRSGIKPSKAYITSFARAKTPLYTVVTRLSLTPQRKGTVKYAVPDFTKAGQTEPEQWAYYAQQYRQIRDFLQTLPDDEDGPATSTAAATPPVPATTVTPPSAPAAPPATPPAAAPPAAPAPVAAPPAAAPVDVVAVAEDDEEDIPF